MVKFIINRRSLSGLEYVKFEPNNYQEVWLGEDKPKSWDDTVSGDMESFTVLLNIKVPDDPELAGKSIEGDIEAKVTYPVDVPGGILVDSFKNKREYIDDLISLHIFTNEELEKLEPLKLQMISEENAILTPMFFGGLGLLGLAGILLIINNSRKKKTSQ